MTNYESEASQRMALRAVNGAEQRIKEINKQLKEMAYLTDRIRKDLIFVRRVKFGPGKGPTGKAYGHRV